VPELPREDPLGYGVRRDLLVAAIVIAIGLIAAASLNGGLYEIRMSRDSSVFMQRVNKITGVAYFS
jgi:hypothetical protein